MRTLNGSCCVAIESQGSDQLHLRILAPAIFWQAASMAEIQHPNISQLYFDVGSLSKHTLPAQPNGKRNRKKNPLKPTSSHRSEPDFNKSPCPRPALDPEDLAATSGPIRGVSWEPRMPNKSYTNGLRGEEERLSFCVCQLQCLGLRMARKKCQQDIVIQLRATILAFVFGEAASCGLCGTVGQSISAFASLRMHKHLFQCL